MKLKLFLGREAENRAAFPGRPVVFIVAVIVVAIIVVACRHTPQPSPNYKYVGAWMVEHP